MLSKKKIELNMEIFLVYVSRVAHPVVRVQLCLPGRV